MSNIERVYVPTIKDNGRILVNGRDLHNALEIKTNYSTWLGRMINEFDFIENIDFFCFSNLESKHKGRGGHNKVDYLLTIDMSKEICMITRNGIGKRVRKYFIQIEKEWNSPQSLLERTFHLMQNVINENKSIKTIHNATNEELIAELQNRLA